jgi:class 3 adenylate cyclase
MSGSTKILVVDDVPRNAKLLVDILNVQGYATATASCGAEALEKVHAWQPDLLLLDVVMPGMDGYQVCRRLRENPTTAILPVVMVTALDPGEERIKGLEAGADDFLTKPVNQPELLVRVRSLVRIKTLFDTVQAQKTELEIWSRTLEQRVEEQVEKLERLGRLRRFLSPQVADLIVSSGDESYLQSHRRWIATLFCDLRGFTLFSETVEPEEAIGVLQTYHKAMGELITRFEGTIDHRAGDGIMVIFNDPLACEQPGLRAVRMALAMRQRMAELDGQWRKFGYELGFGIGMSLGYATLGLIGYEGRFDYTPIGSVVNLAARLCDEARDGQILISQRLFAEVEEQVAVTFVAELALKGFQRPVPTYNVTGIRRW